MNSDQLFCIVVDDEPLAQEVLENYIRRTDELELVAKCESLKEAFEILVKERVDIIFLDLNLRDEYGLDLVAQLNTSEIDRYYIIITTANSSKSFNSKDFFEDDGVLFVDFLTKPFSFKRFSEAISKVIHQIESP